MQDPNQLIRTELAWVLSMYRPCKKPFSRICGTANENRILIQKRQVLLAQSLDINKILCYNLPSEL